MSICTEENVTHILLKYTEIRKRDKFLKTEYRWT